MLKPSGYNFIYDWGADGPLVVYNSLFSRITELDRRYVFLLEAELTPDEYGRLDEKARKLTDDLYKQRFLTDGFVDEFKIIKYRNLVGKCRTDVLTLTVAPTLSCNFGCYYCYEKKESSPISAGVQADVISFAETKLKEAEHLSVVWYGGEPLLEKDIIEEMSFQLIRAASENGCSYEASMITNGYLLDEAFVRKFKDLKISGVQITLDGPPAVHDKRRFLKASHSGTFDTIISNIKTLKRVCDELAHDIRIALRINVDISNEDSRNVDELIDILARHGLKDLSVYPGRVRAQGAFGQASDSCVKMPEFSLLETEIGRKLYSNGFVRSLPCDLPAVKSNYCGADRASGFVIDPEGWIYKCWSDIGDPDRATGSVSGENFGQDKSKRLEMNGILWMTHDPFDSEECRKCRMLPVCMGGCPLNAVSRESEIHGCESIRYSLENTVKRYYNAQRFRNMLFAAVNRIQRQ